MEQSVQLTNLLIESHLLAMGDRFMENNIIEAIGPGPYGSRQTGGMTLNRPIYRQWTYTTQLK